MSSLLSALKKKKTPEQLVRAACAAMAEGNAASLSKRLVAMKEVLYGEEDKEPVEAKCKELSAALRGAGLMPQLIEAMPVLPFEARKDVAQVFNNLVRKNHEGFADYVAENPTMVKDLILAYGNPDIAILCGSMLRECIRYESLARATLADDMLWLFFDSYVHLPNFDVASDAFATLRDLLTRNKAAASEFLSERFDTVFSKYTILLDSENYVTRRQSLKLLGELLLDRSNFAVMMRYICNRDNLKKMMMLLRDKSPNIQYEAFHVFKVFVANPKKPPEITRILVANRAKLITYLENFHNDKDDEQFRDEKALLITTLEALEEPPPSESNPGSRRVSQDVAGMLARAREGSTGEPRGGTNSMQGSQEKRAMAADAQAVADVLGAVGGEGGAAAAAPPAAPAPAAGVH